MALPSHPSMVGGAGAASLASGDVWRNLSDRLKPALARPRLRADLVEVAHHTTRAGDPYVVVRQREAGTYLRLAPRDYDLLRLMDGTRTVRDLVVQYFLRHHVLAFQRVAALVAQLAHKRLLQVDGSDTDVYLALRERLALCRRSWAERLIAYLTGREISLGGLDEQVGRWYAAWGWILFARPATVLLGWIAVLGLVVFASGLWADSQRLLRSGSAYALSLFVLVAFSVIATALHEVGHALALKHVGRHVHRGGFQLYLGLPTFFVDTTDVWMAPPRARLLVSWAGPFTALTLGGLASLGALFAGDSLLGDALWVWALVSYLDVLFNLNPLLELDGYYLLVDALERPRLRPRALAFIAGPLWAALRRRAPLTSDERLLAAFGLASAVWTLFSLWLAAYFWEKRIAALLAELWQTNAALPRLALLLLGAGVAAFGWVTARRAAPTVSRWLASRGALLVRRGAALRQRERLQLLRTLRFMQDLPEAHLVEIASLLRPVRAHAGQAVVREGEIGTDFFLVRRGTLEVWKDGEPVARKGAGDYFGEIALLRRVPRTATVVARDRCDLLALPGDDFRQLVAHELHASVQLQARLGARAELEAFPLLAGLGSRELDLLLLIAERRSFRPGQAIVHQGQPGDRFYVVRSGRVAVEADGAAVRCLGPGDYFGEIALLLDRPRIATVRALGPEMVETWSLEREQFTDVLGRYLGLAPLLQGVGAARLAETLSGRRI